MTYDPDDFLEKVQGVTVDLVTTGEARLGTSFCAVCFEDVTDARFKLADGKIWSEYQPCGHRQEWGTV